MPYYQINQVIADQSKNFIWKSYNKPPRQIIIIDRTLGKEAHFKTKDGRTEGLEKFFGDAVDIDSIVIQQVNKRTHAPVQPQDPIKYESKRIVDS